MWRVLVILGLSAVPSFAVQCGIWFLRWLDSLEWEDIFEEDEPY